MARIELKFKENDKYEWFNLQPGTIVYWKSDPWVVVQPGNTLDNEGSMQEILAVNLIDGSLATEETCSIMTEFRPLIESDNFQLIF